MTKSGWILLVLSVAFPVLWSNPGFALRHSEEPKQAEARGNAPHEEVVLTYDSTPEHIKTSFGRLPDGSLRSNCTDDKGIPLPIRGFRSKTGFKGDYVETSSGKELLFAPVDPVAAAKALVIDDLVISSGTLAGTWKYKSAETLTNKGFFATWVRDDNSSLRTFIPWAVIGGVGISRSQFDAPFCRE